jgi:DNA primase
MADEWLTYEQAGERLGCSAEAARQKAIRQRWHKTKGNDGKARVRLPDGVRTPSERPNSKSARPDERANEQANAEQLIAALNAHIESLKADLTAERARAEQLGVDLTGERVKADHAVAVYVALVEKLAEAERARPWWQRLLIG